MALQRAQGWLELNLPLEANEELEEIQPAMRAHPEVLKLRYLVYDAAKKWDMALVIANFLNRELPDDPWGGTHAATALFGLGRVQEAKDLTLQLAARFPNDWAVRYNLACYCAKLGQIKEAQEWFMAAMAIDEKTVRRVGIADPNLEPLWQEIRKTT
jgi:tetratricopeptide (TPR) repeat protein